MAEHGRAARPTATASRPSSCARASSGARATRRCCRIVERCARGRVRAGSAGGRHLHLDHARRQHRRGPGARRRARPAGRRLLRHRRRARSSSASSSASCCATQGVEPPSRSVPARSPARAGDGERLASGPQLPRFALLGRQPGLHPRRHQGAHRAGLRGRDGPRRPAWPSCSRYPGGRRRDWRLGVETDHRGATTVAAAARLGTPSTPAEEAAHDRRPEPRLLQPPAGRGRPRDRRGPAARARAPAAHAGDDRLARTSSRRRCSSARAPC